MNASLSVPPPEPCRYRRRWSSADLIRVETALQLHFYRRMNQRTTQKQQPEQPPESHHWIKLDDFFTLLTKVELEGPEQGSDHSAGVGAPGTSDSGRQTNDDANADNLLDWKDLSEHERLLFDLLCVSSPSLYQLVQTPSGPIPTSNLSHSDTTTTATPINVWYLQASISSTERRMMEFRKCLQQPVQLPSLAETRIILVAIQDHRSRRRRLCGRHPRDQKPAPLTSGDSKSMESSILQPGMTLEERVRARAEANQQQRQEAMLPRGSVAGQTDIVSATATAAAATAVDRTWLVRIADALWQHSRHILTRQERFQSSLQQQRNQKQQQQKHNNRSAKPLEPSIVSLTGRPMAAVASACISLTLQDAVRYLGSTNSVAAHVVTSTNPSTGTSPPSVRRQLVVAIQELCHLVPLWITVTDEERSKGNAVQGDSTAASKSLSKNATVWIRPGHYQTARAILTKNNHSKAAAVNSTAQLKTEATDAARGNNSMHTTNKLLKRSIRDVTPESDEKFSLKKSKPLASLALTTPFEKKQSDLQQQAVVTVDTRLTAKKDANHHGASTNGEPIVQFHIATTHKQPRLPAPFLAGAHGASPLPSAPALYSAAKPTNNAHNGMSNNRAPVDVKRRAPLRINSSLIFTDADHTGGEILHPSFYFETSPRGLRSLFLRLNQGQRI